MSSYSYDPHGSVVSYGNTTYQYDAFGNQLTDNNTTNPFRYCGEYFDEETGFVYLRNRYYDTTTGRFITEDPAKDGLNWYVYCGNNPVMFIDPSGEFKQGDEIYKYTNHVVYAALKDLTDSWDNLNDLINSGNLNESQIITAKDHLKLIGSLAEKVRTIGGYVHVSEASSKDPIYGSLNNTEKVIYSGYSGGGALVGLASVYAGNDTMEHFGYDEDGTTQNAFKHALWNAYAIAYGSSEIYVKTFTDSHELGNPNNFKTSDAYEGTRMDMHNNSVGRFWGSHYNLFNASQMRDYMKSTLKTSALWIIKSRPAE